MKRPLILAQFQIALMLLTRLPAGRLRGDVPSLADAAWAFSCVGMLVGALGAGVLGAALLAGLPAQFAAALAIAVTVLVTGGLHEDGLADVADGFGGGQSTARKLEIMRDSRIGSYGTLALVLTLLARVLALGSLANFGAIGAAMMALIAIEGASRAGLPLMLRVMPSARTQGLGQSAAAGVTGQRSAAALAFGAAGLILCLGPQAALVVAICMGAVQLGLGMIAMRQIGGQTGDVLGAAQQIGALAGWTALLAV
jgi:adenosylcobinamide-GDP ribazoletransferase